MKLSSNGLTSQLLQELQSNASSSSSVQLAISTSALKDSLENQELILKLLQSVGKGNRINLEA